MAKKVKLWGYRCQRCSHEWLPRGTSEPKVCPTCKSPYWDRPRKQPTDQDNSGRSKENGQVITASGSEKGATRKPAKPK